MNYTMQAQKIIICLCTSRTIIDKEKAASIAAILRGKNKTVEFCADLCRVMQKEETARAVAGNTILACYPRAIRSHFATHHIEPGEIIDIRNQTRENILAQLQVTDVNKENLHTLLEEIRAFPSEPGTDAWYPVIDKERCAECEKCHDFCLFGVYTIREGRVKVAQPQNCKNNCPACARICPAKAIIFPKYERSPINGGMTEEEQALTLDTQIVYTDALRMRLQHRRASISLLKKDKS